MRFLWVLAFGLLGCGDQRQNGTDSSAAGAASIIGAWEGTSGPKEYCSVFCDNGRAVADDNAASCDDLMTSFYVAYEVEGAELVYSDDQGEALRRPFELIANELTMTIDSFVVTFERSGDSHPLCTDPTLPLREREP